MGDFLCLWELNFAIGKDCFFFLGIDISNFQKVWFIFNYINLSFVFNLSICKQNPGETICRYKHVHQWRTFSQSFSVKLSISERFVSNFIFFLNGRDFLSTWEVRGRFTSLAEELNSSLPRNNSDYYS